MTTFPQRLVIHVTEEHIRQGVRYASAICPIALAIQDKLDLALDEGVAVDGAEARLFTPQGPTAIYPLSARAQDFVYSFDTMEHVYPTTFRLRRTR